MNLARVLRRVTLVVSLGLLVLGALIVGLVWWEEKNTWSEATHSRSYDHAEVYVMNLGVVRFPRGSTDQQIKDELDRSAPSASQSSTLYTRGQAIVAAASSEGNALLVLQDLATYYDSPRARAAPFALL